MHRHLIVTCAVLCLLGSAPPAAVAAKAPDSWDGLSLVKSKRFDAAYLASGADFAGYRRVMLDPTEVAFEKNWLRNYNANSTGLSRRLSAADGEEILARVRTGFEESFRKAFVEAGYEVVSASGPDVLRLRTAVIHLTIAAPDNSTGRSRTFTREAGGATVVVELRDSQSGALLGRAVDGRVAGDTGRYLRNSISNRADFMLMFRAWSKSSIDGLAELKARSPVP